VTKSVSTKKAAAKAKPAKKPAKPLSKPAAKAAAAKNTNVAAVMRNSKLERLLMS